MMRYNIVLLIRHPSIDPAIITQQLELIPSSTQRFGYPRITPRGTLLKGLWQRSSWSWHVKCRSKREFFDSVNDLIAKLEPHSEFLSELVLTGGDPCIIVNILGRANIGDVFSWQAMEKLARLKIDLGIEVFPDERIHANERKYCKPES